MKIVWLLLILLPMGCGGGGGGSGSGAPLFSTFSPAVSMNANLSASGLTSEPISNYAAEYQAIYNAGARGAQTAAPWSSLDPTGTGTNTYDLTMITNPYFGLDALAGYGFTSILINIPIVALGSRTMPSTLAALPFDDSAVKDRYHALIDQVLPYLNSSVQYVSLGNEVDTYFSTHASELPNFKALIEDARAYLQSQKPNVKVGVTTTFDGATLTQPANVASLNANMDVIILTYYPTNSSTFVPRNPSTVATDMAAMIAIAGSKPLVLQEWGYPSSTALSSSEQMQADFIANTFTTWRQYGSGRIPFISFFKRRDWNDAQCQTSSGQTAPQHFYEFLCSLGLLNNIGTQKAAYASLLAGISTISP